MSLAQKEGEQAAVFNWDWRVGFLVLEVRVIWSNSLLQTLNTSRCDSLESGVLV